MANVDIGTFMECRGHFLPPEEFQISEHRTRLWKQDRVTFFFPDVSKKSLVLNLSLVSLD